jgi:hypothetical protein
MTGVTELLISPPPVFRIFTTPVFVDRNAPATHERNAMKRLFISVFLIAICFQAVSAREYDREYDRDYLVARKSKFTGMRNAGFTMGIIGSAMLVGGIVLASNGEYETVETPNGTQSQAKDGSAAGGLLLIIAGVPLGVTGFILGGIGSKKVNQYERMLQNTSVGMELGENRKGLRLSYSF